MDQGKLDIEGMIRREIFPENIITTISKFFCVVSANDQCAPSQFLTPVNG